MVRRCESVSAGSNRKQVVESRGPLVAAGGLGDHDEAIVLDFHLFVFKAQLVAKLDAARFKPDQMIGVMRDAHLIGFRVSHSDGCVGEIFHETPVIRCLLRESISASAFREKPNAFAEIGCRANFRVCFDGGFKVGANGDFFVIESSFFVRVRATGPAASRLHATSLARAIKHFRRHNFRNEPEAKRFRGIEDSSHLAGVRGSACRQLAARRKRKR